MNVSPQTPRKLKVPPSPESRLRASPIKREGMTPYGNGSPGPAPKKIIWEQVKTLVEDEARLRKKSKVKQQQIEKLEQSIKDLASEVALRDSAIIALEEKLTKKRTYIGYLQQTVREINHQHDSEIAHKVEEANTLHGIAEEHKAEAKKFRLAFATAFKVCDEVRSKVTMRELLTNTEQHLDVNEGEIGSEDSPAPKRPRYESPAPAKTVD